LLAPELDDEPPEPPEAELPEPLAVIAFPEGPTSHHLAPKPSLPSPDVAPGVWSPM
jgi:hypothetical protein